MEFILPEISCVLLAVCWRRNGFLVGKHQPPLCQGRLTSIFNLSADMRSAIENTLTYQPLYSEARA